MTAIHWAAKRGHLQILALLINSGADVNAKDLVIKFSLASDR